MFVLFEGYVYDVTGDFNASFYAMGAVCTVGGILALIATAIHHKRKWKQVTQTDTDRELKVDIRDNGMENQ